MARHSSRTPFLCITFTYLCIDCLCFVPSLSPASAAVGEFFCVFCKFFVSFDNVMIGCVSASCLVLLFVFVTIDSSFCRGLGHVPKCELFA